MTVMSATFGALPGVQFMRAICCFEAREVNASNGARFRFEMKELQPLEIDHSKLKENFARLRNQSLAAKMLSFCCKNFAAILHNAAVFS